MDRTPVTSSSIVSVGYDASLETLEVWNEASSNPGKAVDIGRAVVCDFCAADHADSEDVGGVICGSHAICPTCVLKFAASIELDRADKLVVDAEAGERFGDFVRRARGGNNSIRIVR